MSPFHKIKDKKKRLSKQAQPETIAINRENHFSLSLPAAQTKKKLAKVLTRRDNGQ